MSTQIEPDVSVGDNYTLTSAGWPRPRVDGLPVPWVAPTHNLGEVNAGRRTATCSGAICQVCGEGFAVGDDAYGFSVITHNDVEVAPLPLEFGDLLSDLVGESDLVSFLDGAVMHFRCAKLTARMCPHVRARTNLVCLRVPANDAFPHDFGNGKLEPTYSTTDCVYVPWPASGPA